MSDDDSNWKIIEGESPILIIAAHNYPHIREGKIKPRDVNTGYIVESLCNKNNAWGIITTSLQKDPNWYEDSPFRLKIKEIITKLNIICVVDIHGRKTKNTILLLPNKYFKIEQCPKVFTMCKFKKNSQKTIGEDLESLETPAIELEIGKDFRTKNSEKIDEVVNIVSDFLKENTPYGRILLVNP